MSDLGNKDIDGYVRVIVGSYLKGVKTRPEDEAMLKTGVALVINLLQNINDIANCAIEANDRANR